MIYLLDKDVSWVNAWLTECSPTYIDSNQWLAWQGAVKIETVMDFSWTTILRFSTQEDKLAFMLKYSKSLRRD